MLLTRGYRHMGALWRVVQEDIFQRTYQDVITDRRDAVALYQDSKDAPQWVRGMMVPYATEEKTVEPILQPLPLDAANEYNTLKERYPDVLVGYEQYGNFEFYGEDAKLVSELLGSKLLEKETALGKVEVSGFPREQWGFTGYEALEAGGERLSVRPAGRWNPCADKVFPQRGISASQYHR